MPLLLFSLCRPDFMGATGRRRFYYYLHSGVGHVFCWCWMCVSDELFSNTTLPSKGFAVWKHSMCVGLYVSVRRNIVAQNPARWWMYSFPFAGNGFAFAALSLFVRHCTVAGKLWQISGCVSRRDATSVKVVASRGLFRVVVAVFARKPQTWRCVYGEAPPLNQWKMQG